MESSSNDRGFVPHGVNAGVWLGFEGRIRERRFQALLANIDAAIGSGHLSRASSMLDEARELRPDAECLAELAVRIAQATTTVHRETRRTSMRPLYAVLMLGAGVALLVHTDSLRQPKPLTVTSQASLPHVDVKAAPPPVFVLPADAGPQPAATTGVLPEEIPGPTPTPVAAPADTAVAALPTSAPEAPPLEREPPHILVETPPARPAAAVLQPSGPAAAREPSPLPARDIALLDTNASTRSAPPVAVMAAPPPAPRDASPAPRDEERVSAVLDAYAHAFGRLDARAARAVWPSVDERALARAFSELASQNIAFDNCAIDVHGTSAQASCRGTASYVGRIGSADLRTEPRTWRFELQREGDAWTIASAVARRP